MPPSAHQDELLTVAQAAAALGRQPSFVYRRTVPTARDRYGRGVIPHCKVGRNTMVPRTALEAWLRRHTRGYTLPAEPAEGAMPSTYGGAVVAKRQSFQEGSVFLLSKRKFQVRWREWGIKRNGEPARIQKSRTLRNTTQTEARRFVQEKIRASNGKDGKGSVPLEQFVRQHWLPTEFGTGGRGRLRPSTRQGYEIILRLYLLPRFGSVALEDIEAADVLELLNHLASQLSTETLKHVRNVLSAVLRMAVELGWLQHNPVRAVRVPEGRASLRPPAIALSIGQVWKLLAQVKDQEYAILHLLVMTGLRRGELCGLRVDALELEDAVLHVREARVRGLFGDTKTKGSVRALPLDSNTVAVLRKHLEETWLPNRSNVVFTTRKGTPLHPDNFLRRVMKRAARLGGLPPVGWNDLRHTHGTLLRPLLPEHLLRQQLGHRPRGVTFLNYVEHDDPELRRAAIEQLGRLLFSKCSIPGLTGGQLEQQKNNSEMPEEVLLQ